MPNLAPIAGSGVPWGEEVLHIATPSPQNREWANRPAARGIVPVFHLLPKPMLVVDAESGQILDCNPALARLLARDPEVILGGQLASLWPPERTPPQREALQRALRDDTHTPILEFALDSGRRLAVKVTACGFFLQNHPLLLLALDGYVEPSFTVRPQVETFLRDERRRLENLRVIASGLAHNFNNILMSILSYAALGRQKFAGHEAGLDCFRKIEEAAMRAGELSRRILVAGVRGPSDIHECSLNELVRSRLESLQTLAGEKVHINVKLGPDVPVLPLDQAKIAHVLTSLVQNAAEAIHTSVGLIQIRTFTSGYYDERRNEGFITPTIPVGPCVVIEVSDNGIGIAPEHLPRIFEPFYSTKFVGRGLSLAEALGAVCAHQGAIQVVSHLGAGTQFRIYLPVGEHVEAHPLPPDRLAALP